MTYDEFCNVISRIISSVNLLGDAYYTISKDLEESRKLAEFMNTKLKEQYNDNSFNLPWVEDRDERLDPRGNCQ